MCGTAAVAAAPLHGPRAGPPGLFQTSPKTGGADGFKPSKDQGEIFVWWKPQETLLQKMRNSELLKLGKYNTDLEGLQEREKSIC